MSHHCFVVALIFLTVATICDIKTGKIPNWLTLPSLILGTIIAYCLPRPIFIQFCLFFVAFFALGCIGIAGWGDIKCVMVVAAFTGWLSATSTFVIANIILFFSYLIFDPKSAAYKFKKEAVELFAARTKIDENKSRYALAPFLLAGYILTLISAGIIYFWRI